MSLLWIVVAVAVFGAIVYIITKRDKSNVAPNGSSGQGGGGKGDDGSHAEQ